MHRKLSRLLVVILLIIAIWGIFKNNTILAYESSTDTGQLVAGETNPSTYSYDTHTGIWNATTGYFTIPTLTGYKIYCIEPGQHCAWQPGRWQITYATAKRLEGKTYTSDGKEASTPNDGERTPPRYTEESTDILPPIGAYLISAEGEFSEIQKALWNARSMKIVDSNTGASKRADEGLIEGAKDSENGGSSQYDGESQVYAQYDENVRNKGLQPEDETDLEKVKVEVNEEKQTYKAGPYIISYNEDGVYNDLKFSGISAMTANGYNKDGKLVKTGITIDKIILQDAFGNDGKEQTPIYFTPNSSTKVDTEETVYPKSGQKFKIVFDNPNKELSEDDENWVTSVSIQVTFQYMLANGKYTKLKGISYIVAYQHTHTNHTHLRYKREKKILLDEEGAPILDETGKVMYKWVKVPYEEACYRCTTKCNLDENRQQDLMAADAIRSLYEQTKEIGKTDGIKQQTMLTMSLSGNVWQDGLGGKENDRDGKKGTINDVPLKNIKVTLYTQEGNIAKLATDSAKGNVMEKINPTYTDENGDYKFVGMDPMKKYYVVFEYNGQKYMPTDYEADSDITSKGTEYLADSNIPSNVKNGISRTTYNNRFASIGSYPNNYQRANGAYNATFSTLQLMGYVLNEKGEYNKEGLQLIDGYLYNTNGEITNIYSEGEISTKVREYINQNHQFPDMNKIYNDIYQESGNNAEVLQKLCFIEDIKMKSYTKAQNGTLDLYPQKNQFTITEKTISSINQGLWQNYQADLALRTDVYKATVQINDKTEVYNYDKRDAIANPDSLWDIAPRIQNKKQYYDETYSRELYNSDYEFIKDAEKELNIYVTYKIAVRNQSEGILATVDEIVDYYDETYTFVPNLSWMMYGDTSISSEDYQKIMINQNKSEVDSAKYQTITTSENSRYQLETQFNKSFQEKRYNTLYITGPTNPISTGSEIHFYLTFQVNRQEDSSRSLMIETSATDAGKQNIAEINGYSTFYDNNTELPNYQTSLGTKAGLIDIDSNSGNLTANYISKENLWEDDTDRAKGLTIYMNGLTREITGTVWEENRDTTVSDAIIGNGVKDANETKIEGIGVALYEVVNGTVSNTPAQRWDRTKWLTGNDAIVRTNSNGEYTLTGFIPGNYVVRFIYGGEYNAKYNGQDYQSTVYQKDMVANRQLTNTKFNDTLYQYDIDAANNYGKNLSDARDIWERREAINEYCNGNGQGVTNTLAKTLHDNATANTNTQMVATSDVIVEEVELQETEVDGTIQLTEHVIQNLDFGLVERPNADLKLTKTVTNIKITLANSTILFDTQQSMNNLLWQPSIDRTQGLIQATMDDEIMHGATIEITYQLAVENTGETDYTGQSFYYYGVLNSSSKKVTTSANQVIDYVANNLQYRAAQNSGWTTIKANELINSKLIDGNDSNLVDSIKQYNTILTTNALNKELAPGETTSTQLILSQLLTAQNKNDDREYKNIAEIVCVSNDAGKRTESSIPGNQNPIQEPQEPDSSWAERVIILPPFGNTHIYLYLVLGVVIAMILGTGIILVKKKVLA